MTEDAVKADERATATDHLVSVAERKGRPLGLTPTQYLAGVLEGRFPRINADDLAELDPEAGAG